MSGSATETAFAGRAPAAAACRRYTYFMGLAFALLALLDAYDTAAEKVRFPDGETQRQLSKPGASHRKVVNLVTDRGEWAKAFRTIHDRLGLLPAAPDIQVVIEDTDDKRPASGVGKDGRGTIRFNMRLLGPYQQKLDDFELARQSGKAVKWVVPPSRLDAIVTHELTHVVCGVMAEDWLTEGIASYTAGEEALFYEFNHRGSKVETLDRSVGETDAYARGMAFFRWMEKEFGQDKVRDFARRVSSGSGEKPGPAAAEVTGTTWDKLLLREQAWSAEYVAKFKTKP